MSESKDLVVAGSTEIADKDLRTEGAQLWTETEEMYGDGRSYDFDRVMGEMRDFYQKSLMNMVEMGKRFHLIKKLGKHGEFFNAIEEFRMTPRTAERYMNCAELMMKSKTYQRFETMSRMSITQMYEICKLSEGDQKYLLEEGQIGGMRIESIPDMSVKALSSKIASVNDEKKALEKQLEEKNKKIDELDREMQLLKKPSQWSERAQQLVLEITTVSVRFNVIAAELHQKFEEIKKLQPAAWSNEKDILRSRSQEVMLEMYDKMDELLDIVDWIAPADNELLQSRHRMNPLKDSTPSRTVEFSEVK